MKFIKAGGPQDIIVVIVFIFIIGVMSLVIDKAIRETIPDIEGKINDTRADADVSTGFSRVMGVTGMLDKIGFAIFAGLVLLLIVSAFLVDTHPIFYPFFILILIISVIISVPLSNAWEEITADSAFTEAKADFPITDHILGKLPVYTVVIGFLGILVLYAKSRYGGGQGAI